MCSSSISRSPSPLYNIPIFVRVFPAQEIAGKVVKISGGLLKQAIPTYWFQEGSSLDGISKIKQGSILHYNEDFRALGLLQSLNLNESTVFVVHSLTQGLEPASYCRHGAISPLDWGRSSTPPPRA